MQRHAKSKFAAGDFVFPGGKLPRDDKEVTDLRWLAPAEALEAQKRGQISLRNPTIRNLMLFTDATSASDALARLRGRTVSTVAPRVVLGSDGARRILMPGDPEY